MHLPAQKYTLGPLNCRVIVKKRCFIHVALVFQNFGGPYLIEFEGYKDSESTFTCLTFHDEPSGILGFVERYRQGPETSFFDENPD